MRIIIGIFVILIFGSFNPNKINYSIEIYLPHGTSPSISNGLSQEFEVKSENLPELPFIVDDEIISFDTMTNKFSFEKQAAERIGKLKPNLARGIPFVLTLDRKPILTGYFWNIMSSFGCKAYLLFNESSLTQKLRKGLPEQDYKNAIVEKRKDYFFIQALERTGRLK